MSLCLAHVNESPSLKHLRIPRCSGLGRATASALARAGAYVSIFDLAEPVDTNQDERVLQRDHIRFQRVNIASTSQVDSAVQDTVRWSNETHAPLGGVVCCAGVLAPGKVRLHTYYY